ncbi:MAG: CYTH domain-containing protein [Candidatus Pacebacteria bacterium]|nr:CYTH domain-containing protein [Candidatus Paceibacterota bacterium]
METEYEATFWPIDKDTVRSLLQTAGATMKYPERLMRRVVFYLPPTSPLTGKTAWARVRDEGDKITMSIKQLAKHDEISDQKEVELTVSSFETGIEMLRLIGCEEKAFQETKRELWELDGVQITIDEWPFLQPFIEIEGQTEEVVRTVSEKLGYKWSDALFCSADLIYMKQYGITHARINDETPRLAFSDPNPFA